MKHRKRDKARHQLLPTIIRGASLNSPQPTERHKHKNRPSKSHIHKGDSKMSLDRDCASSHLRAHLFMPCRRERETIPPPHSHLAMSPDTKCRETAWQQLQPQHTHIQIHTLSRRSWQTQYTHNIHWYGFSRMNDNVFFWIKLLTAFNYSIPLYLTIYTPLFIAGS